MMNREKNGKFLRNPLIKRLLAVMVLLFCVCGAWGADWVQAGINQDMTVGQTTDIQLREDITLNYLTITTSNVCVINLNGHNLTILGNLKLGNSFGAGGQVRFTGEGTVTAANLDTTTDITILGGSNNKKNLFIDENVTLIVNNWYTGEYEKGNVSGSGSYVINGSVQINGENTNPGNNYVTLADEVEVSGTGGDLLVATKKGKPIWTGEAGTNDWNDEGNWSAMPSDENGYDIVIPKVASGKYPEVWSDIELTKLTVSYGASISINGTLSLSGDLNNAGDITVRDDIIADFSSKNEITIKLGVNGRASNLSAVNYPKSSEHPANPVGKRLTVESGTITGTLNFDEAVLSTLTLTGTSQEISSLSMNDTAGSTLEINGNVSVTDFSVSGSEQYASYISGSGTINARKDLNPAGEYLGFMSSAGPVVSGYEYKVAKSAPAADGEYPPGWDTNIETFTWKGGTGATSTDWFYALNWEEGGVPSKNKTVVIPGGKTVYPVLNKNVKIGTGSLTVESGASFDINGHSIFCSSLINEGTVTSSADFEIAGDVSSSGTFTAGAKLSVTGNCEISGGAFQVNNGLSVTGTLELSGTGSLAVAGVSSCNKLFLNSSGEIDFGNNEASVFTAATEDIDLSRISSVKAAGHIAASEGSLKLSGVIAMNSKVVFESPVELEGNTSVSGTAEKTIIFTETLTGNSHSFESGTDAIPVNVEFKNAATGLSSLTINGNTDVAGEKISTSGNQTYNGDFVFGSALTLSANSGSVISLGQAASNKITSSGVLTVDGTVTFNQNSQTGVTAGFVIPEGKTVTLGTALKTSGGLDLKGNLNAGGNNIYLGSDSTFDGSVTSTGSIYLGNKDPDSNNRKTVTVSNNQTAAALYAGGNIDLVINSEVTGITDFYMATDDQNLKDDFSVNIRGSGSLALSGNADISRASKEEGKTGTLFLNIPVTNVNTFTTHSGTSLVVNKDLTVTNRFEHRADNPNPKASVTLNAVLSAPEVSLTIFNNSGNEMTISANGKVKTNSFVVSNTYSNGGNTVSNSVPVTNDGTIEINADGTGITIPAYAGTGTVVLGNGTGFTNNSSAEQKKTITINNLILDNNVSGVIDAGNGEVTVTKLTVNGTSNLETKGSAAASTVNLSSFGAESNLVNLTAESGTLSIGADLVLGGNLETKSGATFNFGAYSVSVEGLSNAATLNGSGPVTISGDFEDTGTWNGTGLITFSGDAIQNVIPKDGTTYPFVEISNTAGTTLALDLKSSTILVKADGILDANEKNLSVTGDLKVEAAGKILAKNGDHSVGADFINAGTFTVVSGNLNVAGNFSNTGTYTAGTGTVAFTGTGSHSVTGETSFSTLECTVPESLITFEDGKTQIISEALILKGEENKNIVLDSVSGTGQWNINVDPSKLDIEYVTITNSVSSENIPGTKNLRKDYFCINGGNNIKWFPETKIYWYGSTETDKTNWNQKNNWRSSDSAEGDIVLGTPDYEDSDLEAYICDISKSSPVLESPINIKKLVVKENAKINQNGNSVTSVVFENAGDYTLSGGAFTVSGTDSSYSNTGKMISSGTETVTLPSGTSSENGTWDYTGGTLKSIANLTYKNIIVSADLSPASSITASGNIEIAADKILTLGNNSITAASVTNNGTILVNGSGRISKNDTSKGLVKYTTCGTSISDFGDVDYYNLELDLSGSSVSVTSSLKIKNDLKIKTAANASFSSTGDLSVEGAAVFDEGAISLTGTAIDFGTVTFNGGTITLGKSSGTVKVSGGGNKLVLENAVFTLAGQMSAPGGIDVAADIETSGNLAFGSNVVIKKSETAISNGTNNVSFESTLSSETGSERLSVTGSGNLKFTGAVGSSKKLAEIKIASSEVTFASSVSADSFVIDGTTTLVTQSTPHFTDVTVNKGKKLTSASSFKISGTLTDSNDENQGFSSTGTVEFTNSSSVLLLSNSKDAFNNLKISGTGSILTTDSSFGVSGNLIAESGCKLNATGGTITFTGTDAGISGDNTFNHVSLNGTASLLGNNSFVSLTVTGNTIFVSGSEQTVTGVFDAHGTSGSKITLKSSETGHAEKTDDEKIWKIKFNEIAAGKLVQYVEIYDSSFTGTQDYSVALNSSDGGNNRKWIFPGQKYSWNGNAGNTDWNNRLNWTPSTVPGKGADVTILKGKNVYPVLSEALNLNYTGVNGKITIEADAAKPGALDLGQYNLEAGILENNGSLSLEGSTLTLSSLTNNGLLKLYGTETFASVDTVTSGSSSKVSYYGPSANTSLWLLKGTYAGIEVGGSTTLSIDIETACTSVINNGIVNVSGNSLSVTGLLNNKGSVNLGASKELKFQSYSGTSDSIAVTSGTITHTGTSDAEIGNLEIIDSVTLNGTSSEGKNLVLSSVTYNEADISTSGNVKIPSGIVKTVTVSSGTFSIDGDLEVTGDMSLAGTFASGGNKVTLSGSGNQNFVPNGNQFTDVVFAGNNVSASGNFSCKNFTNTGKFSGGSETVTVYGNLENTGNFTGGSETFIVTGDLLNTGSAFTAPATVVLCESGNVSVSGVTEFINLKIENTSTENVKTVYFPVGESKKISVTGNFTVNGKELTASSGDKNIILTASETPDADNEETWWYLNAALSKTAVVMAEIRYAYSDNDISTKVTDSVEGPSGDYTTYNWFGAHEYYWFGKVDSSWTKKENWSKSKDSFAGTSKAPRIEDNSSIIEIVRNDSSELVLSDDVTVQSFTVDSDVRVNLAGQTVKAGEITNNGIIVIDGSRVSPLNNKAGNRITHDENSSVEFEGWTSGTAVSATYGGLGLNTTTGFNNLVISGSGDFVLTDNMDLVVSKSAVIKSDSFKNSGSQTFKGLLNSPAGTEITAGTGKRITLSGGTVSSVGHIVLNNDVYIDNDLSADCDRISFIGSITTTNNKKSLLIKNNAGFFGNVTLRLLTVEGESVLGKDGTVITVITDLNQEYKKTFGLSGNTVLNTTSGNLIFDDVITGNGKNLSLQGNAFIKGNVSDVNNFNAVRAISLECDSFEAVNQIFSSSLEIKKDCKITGLTVKTSGIINASVSNVEFTGGEVEFAAKSDFKNLFMNSKLKLASGNDVSALEDIEISDEANLARGSLKAGKNITFNADCNIGQLNADPKGSFVLSEGKILEVSGYLRQGSSVSDTCTNIIKGSILTSGTAYVSFYGGVNVLGNSDVIFGGENGRFTVSKDLIVYLDSASSIFTINSPVTADNFVLYRGHVELNKQINSVKDIVLLGSEYSESDGVAGHEGEYLYIKTRQCSYNYAGLEYGPGSYDPDSSMEFAFGAVLKAGKNFYANGLTLSGKDDSSLWYLDIENNADPEVCFAEAYNCHISESVVRNNGIENSLYSTGVAVNCTDDSGNRNWDFDDFTIVDVKTVSDSVVRVEFSSKIRNSHKELSSNLESITFMNNGVKESFDSIYTEFDIVNQTGTERTKVLGNGEETSVMYFKTKNGTRWNTDATGTSAGNNASTDSTGEHRNAVPSVLFSRSLPGNATRFTNRFGKILKESGEIYTLTHDNANPVLIEVCTGQETHTEYDAAIGQDSQPSYDAHNFIEFRYSEPVDFDNTETSGTISYKAFNDDGSVNYFQNVKVESGFGAYSDPLTRYLVEGIAELRKGAVSTGSVDFQIPAKQVHALYRKEGLDPQVTRISIAGLTKDTVTDNDGNEFKKWVGYIDSATTPSGVVVLPDGECSFIKDQAGNTVNLINVKGLSVRTSSEYSDGKDFGEWDTKKPVFAAYRKASSLWQAPGLTANYESVGSTVDGTSSLKRLEFHVFDNEPLYYNREPQWVSKKGWVKPYAGTNSNPELYSENSYASDIFGGARPFETSGATTGGVRYSTICDASEAFLYAEGSDKVPDTHFDDTRKAYFGASSPIFQPASAPSRSPVNPDGLYFGYKLSNSILSIKTQFTVSYDDSKAYVTDLAGNRLKSSTIRTMDLTPPSITMTLAPAGQKRIFVMFSKALSTGTVSLFRENGTEEKKDALSEAFPQAFEFKEISESGILSEAYSGIGVDSSVPAKVLFENSDYMAIELGLTKEVTYDNIRNLYLVTRQLNDNFKDPVIDLSTSYATFIQDDTGLGNYLPAFSAHALSDFAVNLVTPVYAYNEAFTSGEDFIQNGIFGEDSHAVHDWDAEQKNFGTLLPEGDVHVVASVNDEETLTAPDFSARMYLDNNPDKASLSTEYNKTSKSELRVWLPEIAGLSMFSSLSDAGNTGYKYTDSTYIEEGDLSANLDFTVNSETISEMGEGSQISFLFGITDSSRNPVSMVHSPEYDYSLNRYNLSDKSPLFALRLKNPADLLSLDLWSFRLKKQILQKGNVTILNNVIDPVKGEKTVLKIDNPKSGKVDVIVMTLDGNIVDYLNRGTLAAGSTNFVWNGKNRNGKNVARGMYFIRIIGNGFDETRKVMVVK